MRYRYDVPINLIIKKLKYNIKKEESRITLNKLKEEKVAL